MGTSPSSYIQVAPRASGKRIRFELAGVRVKRVNLHANKYQGEMAILVRVSRVSS